jgi:phosphoglycolate phosphatase-like HAD superfamily hydrolase
MSKVNWTRTVNTFLLALVVCTGTAFANAPDPLPSWNSGTAKKAITNFIAGMTTEHGPDYVPIPERIAVFDNDGTLWSEQPMYVQMVFALDRVKALAPQHPEKQPFKAALEDDMKTLFFSGEESLIELMVATHAGMTTVEFAQIVKDWLATAKNPKTKRLYTEMVFQPKIELMAYVRANGFKTYIVSRGGVEFMRVFSEQVYGVPPEQVIGSTGKTKFELRDGNPVIVRLPEIAFIDDKEGKPVGINQYIGRRPIVAFGNSDGDFQMLE